MEIKKNEYLIDSLNLTQKEKTIIKIFNEWLPDKIIDCHAHCNLPEHVKWIDERAYNHMLSTFPSFSLGESNRSNAIFHPNKIIKTLRFAGVFRGIDHKAVNDYLLEQSPAQDRIALYGLPDDLEYTIGMLGHPRISALKMYYLYIDPPATEIYQYFPKAVLEVAQDKNIPIVLHPPRKITACLDQILTLINDFPRLRICLAHLSLTKEVVPGLKEAFDTIAKYPLVYFDTALVPSKEIVEIALRSVGYNRIMYGSDAPLHLIRSVVYRHPQLGERIVTEYLYHWADPKEHREFKHLATGATHAHWQALNAIKSAVDSFPTNERGIIKQDIFYDNAKLFYGF